MSKRNKTLDWQPLAWSALTIILVLIAWYLVTASGAVRPIFLPSPGSTLEAVWGMIIDGRFFRALMFSFARIATATILATIIGSFIGIAMGVSKACDSLFSPVIQPLRYLPITALIPLLILWFGIGETMRITFLFFGIVFYFIPLVRNAIRSVPQHFIDVARGFGATPLTVIQRVYIPHALPQIFDGLIVINGIGWTYVVLAEIINAQEGLGYLISIAGRLQQSDEVFAGLILIAFVAIASDRLLQWFRNTYFFW